MFVGVRWFCECRKCGKGVMIGKGYGGGKGEMGLEDDLGMRWEGVCGLVEEDGCWVVEVDGWEEDGGVLGGGG